MEGGVAELQTELVQLLYKQIEALELDTCVGLTDAELREYDERQERVRELHAELERH